MLKILPQVFYQDLTMDKVLVDGLSCVIHKKLASPVWHKEGYVSTHAITLVLKGELHVENEDGLQASVHQNQMIFLPKGLYTISDIIPEGEVFEAVVFFFDEELISQYIKSLNLEGVYKNKCLTHLLLTYTQPVRIFTEGLLQLYKNKE